MSHVVLEFGLLFLFAYGFVAAYGSSGSGAFEASYAWDDDGMEDM